MHALVVYESLWGNTGKVANAIAHELESRMTVELVTSELAPTVMEGYDLVVVGGPTHAFSMTRPSTRRTAVENNHAPHAPERGIREWLASLAPVTRAVRAVAFDTRVDSPRLPGSAAKAARHELRSRGFDVSLGAKSFRVHGYEGPLIDGELDRAADWARGWAATDPDGGAATLSEVHHG
jgi:Flavodoxin domain